MKCVACTLEIEQNAGDLMAVYDRGWHHRMCLPSDSPAYVKPWTPPPKDLGPRPPWERFPSRFADPWGAFGAQRELKRRVKRRFRRLKQVLVLFRRRKFRRGAAKREQALVARRAVSVVGGCWKRDKRHGPPSAVVESHLPEGLALPNEPEFDFTPLELEALHNGDDPYHRPTSHQ